MPRDSTGEFTLDPSNPVTEGTPILPAWANLTLSDIEAELTSSLDRQGRGAMSGVLQLAGGAIGAPGLTWGSDTDIGLYRAGANDFRAAVAGVDIQSWTANGIGAPLGVRLGNGTLAAPALAFSAETNSGLYRVNAVGLSMGMSATEIQRWTVTGTAIFGTLEVSGVSTFTGLATFTAGADMTDDRVRNVGTPTATGDAARAGESAPTIIGFGASTLNGPTDAEYLYCWYVEATATALTDLWRIPVPTPGKISKLRIRVATAGDGTGSGSAFTVRKNGSDQTLTATLAIAATSASDTSNSFTVVAGDEISVKVVTAAGQTVQPTKVQVTMALTTV